MCYAWRWTLCIMIVMLISHFSYLICLLWFTSYVIPCIAFLYHMLYAYSNYHSWIDMILYHLFLCILTDISSLICHLTFPFHVNLHSQYIFQIMSAKHVKYESVILNVVNPYMPKWMIIHLMMCLCLYSKVYMIKLVESFEAPMQAMSI